MVTIESLITKGLDYLKSIYCDEAVEEAIEITKNFKVETPAWAYWIGFGGPGDRFAAGGGGYNPLGAARNNTEIAEDATMVHKLTKSAPRVGAHVLWQLTIDGKEPDIDEAEKFHKALQDAGLDGIGSISPTYFIGPGGNNSFTAMDSKHRAVYIDQTIAAAKIANKLETNLLTLWFPDGTNYPGQQELVVMKRFMREGVIRSIRSVPDSEKIDLTVLVEYKLFEPGTYSTTIANPLFAYMLSQDISQVGARGGVLVDLGHHPHGVNVESIVADLISTNCYGGFHFNSSYAADDDQSVEPNPQMARIFHELLYGGVLNNEDATKNWVYALDQMPKAEERIPSILKSIEALKISVARAALYDNKGMGDLQATGDIIATVRAHESALLLADTRPIMWEANRQLGLHPDPLTAYKQSGYQQKIVRQRNQKL